MERYKYKELFNALKGRLTSSFYTQGRRLPGKKKLAGEFGVSEITVARALKELAGAGLISLRERSGAYPAKNMGALRRVFVLHISHPGTLGWLSEFFSGMEEAAAVREIPCLHVLHDKNPAELEASLAPGDGVVFAGTDDPELRARLEKAGVPHIVCCDNSARVFTLGLDHFSAAREMLFAMARAGAKVPAFLGTFCHANHRAAREGFNSAADVLGLYDRYVLNIWEVVFESKMEELLRSRPQPDSFMFLGESLFQIAALPQGRYVQGVIHDAVRSPDVASLAFTVRHSMRDTGRRAVEDLFEIAENKPEFFMESAPFSIIAPVKTNPPS